MSDIQDTINRLEKAAKKVRKTVKHQPRWLSSRLWITVGAMAALLWLVQGHVEVILTQITILIVTFLVCRTATDIVRDLTHHDEKHDFSGLFEQPDDEA